MSPPPGHPLDLYLAYYESFTGTYSPATPVAGAVQPAPHSPAEEQTHSTRLAYGPIDLQQTNHGTSAQVTYAPRAFAAASQPQYGGYVAPIFHQQVLYPQVALIAPDPLILAHRLVDVLLNPPHDVAHSGYRNNVRVTLAWVMRTTGEPHFAFNNRGDRHFIFNNRPMVHRSVLHPNSPLRTHGLQAGLPGSYYQWLCGPAQNVIIEVGGCYDPAELYIHKILFVKTPRPNLPPLPAF